VYSSKSGNDLLVHQVLDTAYASRMIRRIGCQNQCYLMSSVAIQQNRLDGFDMASLSTPALLAEIMSKGKRMTYEELCNEVLPYWPNPRKHNGERYAYSSHSQAVLDCLRNRKDDYSSDRNSKEDTSDYPKLMLSLMLADLLPWPLNDICYLLKLRCCSSSNHGHDKLLLCMGSSMNTELLRNFMQSLLYWLSGDYNPLHSDPKLAEVAGRICRYIFTNEKEVVNYVTRMAPLLCLNILMDSLHGTFSGGKVRERLFKEES
ncbi:hypothetical protein Tco_1118397, partial [Tanacetum coccineum]